MKDRRDIATLALSTRTRNLLRDRNVKTLGQLLRHNAVSLLRYRGFGRASLTEVHAALHREGLKLAPLETFHGLRDERDSMRKTLVEVVGLNSLWLKESPDDPGRGLATTTLKIVADYGIDLAGMP